MDATVLILKELQEIKEQLQNISDALKPKETITYYYEEGDKSTRPYSEKNSLFTKSQDFQIYQLHYNEI